MRLLNCTIYGVVAKCNVHSGLIKITTPSVFTKKDASRMHYLKNNNMRIQIYNEVNYTEIELFRFEGVLVCTILNQV